MNMRRCQAGGIERIHAEARRRGGETGEKEAGPRVEPGVTGWGGFTRERSPRLLDLRVREGFSRDFGFEAKRGRLGLVAPCPLAAQCRSTGEPEGQSGWLDHRRRRADTPPRKPGAGPCVPAAGGRGTDMPATTPIALTIHACALPAVAALHSPTPAVSHDTRFCRSSAPAPSVTAPSRRMPRFRMRRPDASTGPMP
jgi:hypothetical protein